MSTHSPDLSAITHAARVIQELPHLMKAHREALGVGTHLAGEACGLQQQTYWQLETGRTPNPNSITILRVLRWLGAEIIDVDCTCLYFGEDHEPRCFNRSAREIELQRNRCSYDKDLFELAGTIVETMLASPDLTTVEELAPSKIDYVRGVVRRQAARHGYQLTSRWGISEHHRPRYRREDLVGPYTFWLYKSDAPATRPPVQEDHQSEGDYQAEHGRGGWGEFL